MTEGNGPGTVLTPGGEGKSSRGQRRPLRLDPVGRWAERTGALAQNLTVSLRTSIYRTRHPAFGWERAKNGVDDRWCPRGEAPPKPQERGLPGTRGLADTSTREGDAPQLHKDRSSCSRDVPRPRRPRSWPGRSPVSFITAPHKPGTVSRCSPEFREPLSQINRTRGAGGHRNLSL